MGNALSYAEARAVVMREMARVGRPAVEEAGLRDCHGRVLARNVMADRDYPPTDRTARDGFAVRAADLPGRLRVIGVLRAGERFDGSVSKGKAVEIMTGGTVPDGTDSIIMVEHVSREGDWVSFDGAVPVGQYVNHQGGEAEAGVLLLREGTRVGCAEVAQLASVGCSQVPVFARPVVAIIATGDELVEPGEAALPHQIRNSNAYALAAQVERAGGIAQILGIARDDLDITSEMVARGLEADLLLLSGGVSAGKFDFVEAALAACGAKFFFDRVAIQPGQPLVFGRARGKFFFGLPGNPASTMVTFRVFAQTVLEALGGETAHDPLFTAARLTKDFKQKPGLTRFLPSILSGVAQLTPVGWTGSSDIAALTRANAWMVTDPERGEWEAGDWMPVLV